LIFGASVLQIRERDLYGTRSRSYTRKQKDMRRSMACANAVIPLEHAVGFPSPNSNDSASVSIVGHDMMLDEATADFFVETSI
jgi:hypothetical protein